MKIIYIKVLKKYSMKKNDIYKNNNEISCARRCENIFEKNKLKVFGIFPFIPKIKRINFRINYYLSILHILAIIIIIQIEILLRKEKKQKIILVK